MRRPRTACVWLIALVCITTVVVRDVNGASAASPAGGAVIFGFHPLPTTQQEIVAAEKSVGHQLHAIRIFRRWDAAFPTAFDTWVRDNGHTAFLSVAARRLSGTPVLWSDIAAAQPGSALYDDVVRWARAVRGFAAPVYFLFSPEPGMKRNADMGTSAGFIDAWRRVVTIFREQGVTNATYVWTMTDESFSITGPQAAPLWYPGDQYVDAIGADAYNWYRCMPVNPTGPWRSFSTIVDPVRRFGLLHPDEMLMLPEFGTVEDPATPGRKAQWLRDALATLRSPGWEQFRAALYYNTTDPFNPACTFRFDTSATSLTAFAELASDPYLSMTGTLPPGPTPTPSPDPTTSPTPDPTASPTPGPTTSPTPDPTASPTPDPTASPTPDPTPSATTTPTNRPPVVSAGADVHTVRWKTATLTGAASDDGLPSPGVLSLSWSKVSGPGSVTFGLPTSAVTSATFSAAGTYVLRLTGSDSDAMADDDVVVTVAAGLDVRVAIGSDDAEEVTATGAMSLTSDDLDLVVDGAVGQSVGVRFQRITIPAGARVTRAYLEFRADEVTTGPTALVIAAQAADNPGTFTSATRNLSSRLQTGGTVSWVPGTWSSVGAVGPAQRTSDVSAVVQEVVGRSGWRSGNAIVFVVTGTGQRVADSFEGGLGPLLHVEYVPA